MSTPMLCSVCNCLHYAPYNSPIVFHKFSGGVTSSMSESVITRKNQSDMPDVQAQRSVRDTGRDSGLSGKERRNLRRNGTPVLSTKGTTENSPSPALTTISASAFSSGSSSSSSSSSRDSNNGSGINSMGGRNGPRTSSKTITMSSSTSITDLQILEKKRKQPSSSSGGLATGMFLNDVISANSITDVDKRMGTTATKSSSSNKKQRR